MGDGSLVFLNALMAGNYHQSVFSTCYRGGYGEIHAISNFGNISVGSIDSSKLSITTPSAVVFKITAPTSYSVNMHIFIVSSSA